MRWQLDPADRWEGIFQTCVDCGVGRKLGPQRVSNNEVAVNNIDSRALVGNDDRLEGELLVRRQPLVGHQFFSYTLYRPAVFSRNRFGGGHCHFKRRRAMS